MEYLFLLGIIVGTFILFSKPFYNIYQHFVGNTYSHYFGEEQEGMVTPFVSKGSRHLADQTVVHALEGKTTTDTEKTLQQVANPDGSRSLLIVENEFESSPGAGEFAPMPEYNLTDMHNEPPEYVPPFVNADQGWIEPAVRN